MEKLSFLITKTGFRIDDAVAVSGNDAEEWKNAFFNKPYETLYRLAFQESPACFDAAGVFLCQVAERFAEELFAAISQMEGLR